MQFLSRVTDPYLDWWRQRFTLRFGFMDFSPLIAIMALQIVQSIVAKIAVSGRISLGIVLVVILDSLWSIVSFILVFCIIVLVIRLIGYFMGNNMYTRFWQIVDAISRSITYRVSGIFFANRTGFFLPGIILSIVLLGIVWMGGGILIRMLATNLMLNAVTLN
jgi:hypothetical protein